MTMCEMLSYFLKQYTVYNYCLLHPIVEVLPSGALWPLDRLRFHSCLFPVCPIIYRGLPRWRSGEESIYECSGLRFNPWVGKVSRRRKQRPTQVFLPGKCQWQASVAGWNPWSCTELDMTERLSMHY